MAIKSKGREARRKKVYLPQEFSRRRGVKGVGGRLAGSPRGFAIAK